MASSFKHHKYTYTPSLGREHHHWELVGPNGAIHFHASASKSSGTPSCGLEVHRLSGEGAPDHLHCPLTGGRCWHDGTSLYANETLWPMIEPYLAVGDHAEIFSILEHEYVRHFNKGGEAHAD